MKKSMSQIRGKNCQYVHLNSRLVLRQRWTAYYQSFFVSCFGNYFLLSFCCPFVAPKAASRRLRVKCSLIVEFRIRISESLNAEQSPLCCSAVKRRWSIQGALCAQHSEGQGLAWVSYCCCCSWHSSLTRYTRLSDGSFLAIR